MADRNVLSVVIGVLVLGAFLIVLLIPMSFSDVQYYEYGLLKRRSTGSVSLDKVYKSGRHFVGPDYTFKTFRADAHFVDLNRIAVYTSDKVEVVITCTFQYFLRPKYLAELHQAYDLDYKPVVKSTAIDAIKGQAAQLPIDSYIRKREDIETQLYKALLKRLDGCCRATCADNTCHTLGICVTEGKCSQKDKGLFIEVRYFQLQEVDIHNDVKSRYLSQVIEAAEEERAKFILKEKVVRKETERLVNQVGNEATIISQNASAQATVIVASAQALALLQVENARTQGLKNLYNTLGISASRGNFSVKASLIYLRTLRNKKNVSLNVNYKSILLKG